ncbi:MAG TPA: DUF4178 domain-containing protein [Anaerolineae bacterium]
MPIEVKRLDCPHCGAPLDLKNAGRSRSIVCSACHSQIDLTDPEHQVLGNVGEPPKPLLTPFVLGKQGEIEGETYEVIGRVRYRDPEGYPWDEWLILSAAGAYRWLSDSEEEGLTFWESFTPETPVDVQGLEAGVSVNLTGRPERIRAKGDARIDYLEGELTWKAKVGDTMNYAEGEGAQELHSIEWTTDEVEFYRGHKLDRRAVEKAFGIEAAPLAAGLAPGAGRRGCGCSQIMFVVLVVFILVIILAAVTSAAGSGGSSGTGGSSGSSFGIPSMRIGSPGRSTGGGFHGSSSSSGGHGGK